LSADLVRVGVVGRPHGLDGAFVVEAASEDPARFRVGGVVLVDGVPATIVESKRAGGRPVVRVDREVGRGAELSVPRSQLPAPDPDAYYVFQLVGLVVEEEGGRSLGRVADVVAAPANDVLELDSGLALPFVAECVREVRLDEGRILISPGFADPLEIR
jgi:16S rRNA processing protein RimM